MVSGAFRSRIQDPRVFVTIGPSTLSWDSIGLLNKANDLDYTTPQTTSIASLVGHTSRYWGVASWRVVGGALVSSGV